MTIKQQLAAKKIAENHGNVSAAMLAVGYSKNTAKKPSNLTQSKGWTELMEEYLPDSLLAKVNQDGLVAMKQLGVRTGKDATAASNDFIEVEDLPTRHKYLETALKLKGRFVEKQELTGNIQFVIKRE